LDALPAFRGVNEEGEAVWVDATHDYSLDVIGGMMNDDAVLDDDGMIVVTEATPMPGYHANIRLMNDDFLSNIPESITIPTPANPLRRWA